MSVVTKRAEVGLGEIGKNFLARPRCVEPEEQAADLFGGVTGGTVRRLLANVGVRHLPDIRGQFTGETVDEAVQEVIESVCVLQRWVSLSQFEDLGRGPWPRGSVGQELAPGIN